MTLTRSAMKSSITRTVGVGATAALVVGLMLAPQQASAADIPAPDGRSELTAAASCWEAKQRDPAAESGVYWILTPKLGAAEQFYCDQQTDGGGWVLIGRGREGWSTSNEGWGTPAQVRSTVTGQAAFSPRQLPSRTIEALLNGNTVSSLSDGIRLRRATTADGSDWQESTFTFASPRDEWLWQFDNEQRVDTWN
ncbi:MAG TPA: fibrinogen-like YCDxxxxGGGW domain-containing protein, partial [Marisediminicola sp.]|nr:fibrinogen-like YCDxxxxGGGW domain-containing protein [Marisediminicola sp.]